MILFRLMFRLLITTVLLCVAALLLWLGVLAGYGAFIAMAVVLVFLAYENAYRAFFGASE